VKWTSVNWSTLLSVVKFTLYVPRRLDEYIIEIVSAIEIFQLLSELVIVNH